MAYINKTYLQRQFTNYTTKIGNIFSKIGHTHTKSDIVDFPTLGTASTKDAGVANGVATLDSQGLIPSSQLPGFVDDVVSYTSKSAFPTTGEDGKIYIDKTTNLQYRWDGTDYIEISKSLALGETSSTAYAGDKGKKNADDISAINTALGNKQDKLTAGANITIDEDNVISSTGGGSGNTVELTQAEYDALSESEKKNGTLYIIKDTEPAEYTADKVAYKNTTVDAELTSIERDLANNGYGVNAGGKNLFYFNGKTQTINGITFTYNGEDETYTLNGTSTAYTTLIVNNDFYCKYYKTYKLVGLPKNCQSGIYNHVVSNSTEIALNYGQETGDGVVFYPSTNLSIYLEIDGGTTVSNLIYKPMLTTDTSLTYADYKPYFPSNRQINNSFVYSKVEKKTSKKWIDGKDIYSRTFEITSPVKDTLSFISEELADSITNYSVMIIKSSGTKHTPFYASATNYASFNVGIYGSTNKLYYYFSSSDSASKVIFTVEYTKLN